MEIYFKGRLVSISDNYIAASLEERQEGEAWIEMRERTKPARDLMDRENEKVREELRAILEANQ